MYGLESDENRENEMDCVWVGNTTNYASKYSDIASGGEIFISDNVFKHMSDEYRKVFVKSAKYKGTKLFQGYVTKDYYLEFSEDLGKPIKIDEDTTVELDTFAGLADGIREIDRLKNSLVQRERELAILEERLKKENDELKRRFSNENNEKIKAINEREKAEEQLQTEIETTYSFVYKIISGSFCRQLEYIDNIGINRWLDIDIFYHELGKKQGYNEDKINSSVFEFIEIYAYFGRYSASYRYMVSMAKENDTWVYINESTFKWACEQNLGWQVINAMENRLKNNKIRYEHIKDYEEKICKLKKIRGF